MTQEELFKKLEIEKEKERQFYSMYRPEKEVEKRLCEGVKALGGLCWKFVSPGRAGVPDRIVFIPSGQLYFIELKAPGKYPSAIQYHVHDLLRGQKQQVVILSSFFEVDRFLNQIKWFVDRLKNKNQEEI